MPDNRIHFEFTLKKALFPDKELRMNHQQGYHTETFECINCHMPNAFEIYYYRNGHPLEELYKDHAYISREELLQNKVAQKAYAGEERWGELTLWHVPALYLAKKCTDCRAGYLIVFGMGEIQPGRETLQISGIWKIARTDDGAMDLSISNQNESTS